MHTSLEHEDFLYDDACGCEQCGTYADTLDVDDEPYDDPYEVVMYDIDTGSDDLYALFDMLEDKSRAWYAKRRLNALAASGRWSALVAAIIIDSLGRRWDPLLHPRDRFGRFIETGGFIRWLMKGVNLRGQVSRIDSDGNIHVRSVGNDSIPDGSVVRFKPEQASKLISIADPVADLTPGRELPAVDLDADIPDFPEASATQRRIYNALAGGDMPAADLDVYRSPDDGDLTGTDFASELTDLQERGLIEIDTDGSRRVRRTDDAAKAVLDIGDDELDDVPDDEVPELEDSPAFTRAQRDLLDRIVDADRGEGDGVGRDELEDVDDADLQALIDAGALEENEDGRLFLENPEGSEAPAGEAPETDISQEIFEASQDVSDDPDVQEAFQHFAEELARPGDEANIPLPEELAPAKRRNAEAAARKWWEERNGVTPDAEDAAPEGDIPEAEQVNPKDVLNPRNQALADENVAGFFPDDDEFLDGKNGVELRGAVKRLLDAEDLEENGFDAQAAAERDKAERAMRRIEVPENEIPEWFDEAKAIHNGEREDVTPEVTPEEVTPEPAVETPTPDVLEESELDEIPVDLPGDDFGTADVPEEDLPEPAVEEPPTWKDFDARLAEEEAPADFFARLDQENRIADELGLDLHSEDAPWSWEALSEGIGFRPAELLYIDSDGSLGAALAKDPDPFVRQYENELLDKFFNREESGFGPEVMRLRQAGLVESIDGGNDWRLTEAGRERLGLVDKLPAEDELQAEEVDLPSEPELVDVDLNPRKIEGQRNFKPEDIPLLNNDDEWGEEAVAVGAQDVGQAMWDAQNGFLNPEAAYEIAAEEVAAGRLNQNDLNKIQDAVKQHLEDRGQKWVPGLEIDFVGDDQRGTTNDLIDQALGVRAPEEAALFVPGEADFVPAADKPAHAKVINQPDFFENKPDLSQEGDVLDRNGRRVVLGGWYKANRGGEGDPDQVVGFLNQDKYPGMVLIQTPDGKMKIVDAQGKGPLAGLNRQPDPGTEVRERLRVQRAVGGDEILDLDQNNPKNVLWAPRGEQGQMAEIGMRVKGRGTTGLFRDGDEGVIVRIGWNAGQNRPNIFVVKPGQKNEIQLAPRSLIPDLEGTPTPPPTPSPGAPNLDPNNLPNREWPVPSDVEMVDRLRELGGEADLVGFVNAHVAPGVVYEQVQSAIARGDLEMVPGQGDAGPKLRVPGGVGGVPEPNLPDGAEDEFEAAVLNAIDGAGEGGLRKADIVPNLDDDDAGDRLIALRGLVERGVLRESVGDDGRPRFERDVATPEPDLPNGAQNQLEADILNTIDAAGEGGGIGNADLVDIDADDAADRLQALRALVDRSVLRRDTDENGRPVYRRAGSSARGVGFRSHDPSRGTNASGKKMSREEAADALRAGADPMTIDTDDLYRAMKDSGRFEKRRLGWEDGAGIGDSEFMIDRQVNGPHPVNAVGDTYGRAYFVKKPNESGDTRKNWRSELFAAAISQAAGASDGDPGPNAGLLYHPQTSSANGSRVIADHAAYGFPAGTRIVSLTELGRDEKRALAQDRVRLALYDYLINNSTDRHAKNQMYAQLPDGTWRVVIIDNGLGDGASPHIRDHRDVDFRQFATGHSRNRTRALLQDIGQYNNNLTRDDLRAIVESFNQQYGSINAQSLLQMMNNGGHDLNPTDVADLEKWFASAEARAANLSTNIDSVVDTLASVIGIP